MQFLKRKEINLIHSKNWNTSLYTLKKARNAAPYKKIAIGYCTLKNEKECNFLRSKEITGDSFLHFRKKG